MGLRKDLLELMQGEARAATKEFGPFKSPHEAYGVLKEEFEEWWDSIKKNEFDDYELLQVVAVGYRYLLERVKENPNILEDISVGQIGRWCYKEVKDE